MNIDERLEKLAERTEALTQSVELLAAMHKDNEKRYDERTAKTDRQIRRLGRYIHSIGTLVLDHDLRLRDLEGEDDADADDADEDQQQ